MSAIQVFLGENRGNSYSMKWLWIGERKCEHKIYRNVRVDSTKGFQEDVEDDILED